MIPLTIHLLVHNNESTIELALESIKGIPARVIVADTGCSDKTIAICKSFGHQVKKISSWPDRSRGRNELVSNTNTPWQMYLEPYEVILSGQDLLSNLLAGGPRCYHCEIIQGDIITKEIRLWHKDTQKRFTNPIYETIKDESSCYAGIIFCREAGPQHDLLQIESWKKNNLLAADPYYFQAFACLTNQKYQDFLNLAEHYLFKEKRQTISTVMTRYYMGFIEYLILNDYPKSIRNTIGCISIQPLMAEFWCLLGDIFFAVKQFNKSRLFYENAIILGSKRFREDRWPVQISKYEEYPNEMIAKINNIEEHTEIFFNKLDQGH